VEARFSAPVQTGAGAHPASYTVGIGSFPGVKRPGRGVFHPPPSSAEVKKRVALYIYSSSATSWPFLGLALPIIYLKKSRLIRHDIFVSGDRRYRLFLEYLKDKVKRCYSYVILIKHVLLRNLRNG